MRPLLCPPSRRSPRKCSPKRSAHRVWTDGSSCSRAFRSSTSAMSSRSTLRLAWRVADPGVVQIADHESADGRHRIGERGEHRRIAAQEAPVLAAQNLAQVNDVAVDRFHVWIASAVEDLEIAIRAAEVTVEPCGASLGHEVRRLAQQIESRCIPHLPAAVRGDRQRHAAENELGIQAVAALLEITAVRHLADHVGRADQMTEGYVEGIGYADLGERNFVPGEMHDLARDRRPPCESDTRQVFLEKTCPAGDVHPRELGAVPELDRVVLPAQITHVVKQTDDQAYGRPLGTEAEPRLLLALVAHDEPRQGERDVERV